MFLDRIPSNIGSWSSTVLVKFDEDSREPFLLLSQYGDNVWKSYTGQLWA